MRHYALLMRTVFTNRNRQQLHLPSSFNNLVIENLEILLTHEVQIHVFAL